MRSAGGDRDVQAAAVVGVGFYGLATLVLAVLLYTGSRWVTAAAGAIYVLMLLAARAVVVNRR